MADTKQPEDHKKKDELFSFDHDGETYTFPVAPKRVLTPRVLREHRRRDEVDLAFTILEAMAGDDEDHPALKALDSMDADEFNDLQESLNKFNKVSLGER